MDLDAPTSEQPAAAYVEAQRALASLAAMLTAAMAAACRREWAALDPAHADAGDAGAVIDPEALLLASAWLAPHDQALAATMHAWVEAWSDLLSVQRTRNIARAFPPSVQGALHALAVTAYERGKDFRWSPLVKGGTPTPTGTPLDDDGSAAPPTASHGARLPVQRTALLMLRLRMAFGVGARPDALAYLLAREGEWCTITAIATATGYTPSAIRRALDRMAEAQVLQVTEDGATRYRCAHDAWASLLSLPQRVPAWGHSLQVRAFVAQFAELADGLSRRKLTAYAIGEQVRTAARKVRVAAADDAQHAWEHAFRDGAAMPEMEAALVRLAGAIRAG